MNLEVERYEGELRTLRERVSTLEDEVKKLKTTPNPDHYSSDPDAYW